MPLRYVAAGVVASVAVWALASTAGFIRARDAVRPKPEVRTMPPETPEFERAELVRVGSLREVRTAIQGAGLGYVLVLTSGGPRSVTTSAGEGRGIFAETVYRVRGRRVVLRQATAAPPTTQVRAAYVPDVPATAQSDEDFYWADRGFVLSLSRTGAGVAGDLRWFPSSDG